MRLPRFVFRLHPIRMNARFNGRARVPILTEDDMLVVYEARSTAFLSRELSMPRERVVNQSVLRLAMAVRTCDSIAEWESFSI